MTAAVDRDAAKLAILWFSLPAALVLVAVDDESVDDILSVCVRYASAIYGVGCARSVVVLVLAPLQLVV